MGEHTPGPWKTGREDMQSYEGLTGQPFWSVYAQDPRAGVHLGTPLPLLIARLPGAEIEQAEGRANAKLIAAAPELAEALENTLYLAQKWADGVGRSHPDHEVIVEAVAALKKAGLR